MTDEYLLELGRYHAILYNRAQFLLSEYGGQIRQDLHDLAKVGMRMRRMDKPARHILEIGTYDGGWPFMMNGMWHKDFQYIGVDNDTLPGRRAIREKVLASIGHGTTQMWNMDSTLRATANAVAALMPSVDILHIDGAHGSETVLSDWEVYSPMVRKGGLIVLHDLQTPGILNIWNRLIKPHYKCEDLSGYVYQITHRGGVGVVHV